MEIRPPQPGEMRRFLEFSELAFHNEFPPAELETDLEMFDPARCLWQVDGDAVAGTTASFLLDLTVPGARSAPAAGVTIVGVAPGHRRRGVMSALVTRQLAEARDRGEPLAVLWASAGGIYDRLGFGLGCFGGRIELDTRHAALQGRPSPAETRIVALADAAAAAAPIYDRARRERPGMYARSPAWWRRYSLSDRPDQRDGAGPLFCAVVAIDGEDAAYALYRVRPNWTQGGSESTVEVREAIAGSAAGEREIWRYLCSLELTTRVTHRRGLPLDHPLLHCLRDPRRLRFTLGDQLWVRVLDVEAALAARAVGDAEVVIELADETCPWNAGRWHVGPGGAARTTAAPELVLGAAELGAAYLGGASLTQLHRAGRVEEATAGALARADRAFASAPVPWCAEMF